MTCSGPLGSSFADVRRELHAFLQSCRAGRRARRPEGPLRLVRRAQQDHWQAASRPVRGGIEQRGAQRQPRRPGTTCKNPLRRTTHDPSNRQANSTAPYDPVSRSHKHYNGVCLSVYLACA